ncbi:lipase family protein [Agaribacter marinus]|uniref:Fungal lipase-type domain-containing protein n=1 Tax=Agaribacter marinus TaxID=1431249 RepID=A0AA37T197_9ALTE|nr:lipase family protein [Agaribacter marinus]GLR71925.1 hypothetical protein GCM10007852_28330 [Agaribacter marinus]
MPTLSPLNAAKIADAAYNMNIVDSLDENREGRNQQTGLRGTINEAGGFDASKRFEGQSGYDKVNAPVLFTKKLALNKGTKQTSGFGFFALGEGNRRNEAIVSTRGTATMSDVLTDLWTIPKVSPLGTKCHSGFIDTFESYFDDLKAFSNDIKNTGINTVHCVGHSLGGALASLNAEYFARQGYAVNLYTFGSPRVGYGSDFKQALESRRVKAFRVYNDGDPVPMVPCWPFVHTHGDCCIQRQVLIAPSAHSMTDSYMPSAAKFDSWSAVQRIPDPLSYQNVSVLEAALETGKHLGASTQKIIMYILKRLIRSAQVIVAASLITILSTLDFLAWLLHRAATLAVNFKKSLASLLKGVLRFIGKAAVSTVQMTETFIRYLLEQLFRLVSNKASMALIATLASPNIASMPVELPMVIMGAL